MRPKPEARHCPACGAPQPHDEGRVCEFCGCARVPLGMPDPRHSIRCPGCAGLAAEGASFCSACGHALARVDEHVSALRCAACGDEAPPMSSWGLQPTARRPHGHRVSGCKRCGGAWVDRETLEELIDAASRRVVETVGDRRTGVQRREIAPREKVVYRRCPACEQTMARRNFGRVSGVIVDECTPHGTYFDVGELAGVLSFVESGGLRLAREVRAREDALAAASSRSSAIEPIGHAFVADPELASLQFDLVTAFAAWSARWLGDRLF